MPLALVQRLQPAAALAGADLVQPIRLGAQLRQRLSFSAFFLAKQGRFFIHDERRHAAFR
jgi:hypothetical protein